MAEVVELSISQMADADIEAMADLSPDLIRKWRQILSAKGAHVRVVYGKKAPPVSEAGVHKATSLAARAD